MFTYKFLYQKNSITPIIHLGLTEDPMAHPLMEVEVTGVAVGAAAAEDSVEVLALAVAQEAEDLARAAVSGEAILPAILAVIQTGERARVFASPIGAHNN